jgi:hypothetical protein
VKPLRFSVALQLFVVFASGVLVGGLGYRLYNSLPAGRQTMKAPPPPPGRGGRFPFRERYVQEMRERLKLREEQVRRLNDILEMTGRSVWDAKRRQDTEMKALQDRQQAQIRAMLDPPQVTEYEKMLREREEQMKLNRGRSRPPRHD